MKTFSKTAFVILSILILSMIIISPIIGILSGKILGAIAIGWIISGILIFILMLSLSDQNYQLNDDLNWKFRVSNNISINKEKEKESYKL